MYYQQLSDIELLVSKEHHWLTGNFQFSILSLSIFVKTELPDSEGFEDIEKHCFNAWIHVAVAPLLPRLFSGLGARVAGVRGRGARCAMVSECGAGVAEVSVGLQQSAVNQQSLPTARLSWGCLQSTHC